MIDAEEMVAIMHAAQVREGRAEWQVTSAASSEKAGLPIMSNCIYVEIGEDQPQGRQSGFSDVCLKFVRDTLA